MFASSDGLRNMPPRRSSLTPALFARDNLARAARVASVVGPILVMLNHFDCWQRQALGSTCLWQSVATLFVPFAVSAYTGAASTAQSSKEGDPK
jgi:hypothetical protein